MVLPIYFDLIDYAFNVAHQGNVLLSETKQNTNQAVQEVQSWQELLILDAPFDFALQSKTTLIFSSLFGF